MADAFEGFCDAVLLGPSPKGDVVRRIDKAAGFFVTLDGAFGSPGQVSGWRLRDLMGAEGLRRAEAPAAYLCRQLGFRWDDPPQVAEVAGSAGSADPQGHASLLDRYRLYLAQPRNGRVRAECTRRAYLRTAAALVAFAERDGRACPSSRDARRFLWRTPGNRASVGRFLTWLRAHHGVDVELPRARAHNRKAAERQLIAEISSILSALDAATTLAASRALLAACLARSFGLPLPRVLSLSHGDIRPGPCLALCVDGLELDVPQVIAVHLAAAMVPGGGLLFPGRTGQRPLSTAAVAHHVGKTRR